MLQSAKHVGKEERFLDAESAARQFVQSGWLLLNSYFSLISRRCVQPAFQNRASASRLLLHREGYLDGPPATSRMLKVSANMSLRVRSILPQQLVRITRVGKQMRT